MLDQFREIWLVDFEFMCPPGERPVPLCLAGREFRSGKLLRVWFDDSTAPQQCPIPTGPDVLFVAYYASAELGCYLAHRWPLPLRVIDLSCEFRNLTNEKPLLCGAGLLGALAWFGLDAIDAAEKNELRELAMRGGPYSQAERVALLNYCQTDVDSLNRLLPKIEPTINVAHASSRLHRWEDAGKDYSSWPGLDESARELAGTHPELGSATVTNLTRTPTPPITRGRCGMCCGMTGILCS